LRQSFPKTGKNLNKLDKRRIEFNTSSIEDIEKKAKNVVSSYPEHLEDTLLAAHTHTLQLYHITQLNQMFFEMLAELAFPVRLCFEEQTANA